MKVIFERETEIGRCNADRLGEVLSDSDAEWTALAFTTAATSGTKGMLRVEQRCYLRSMDGTADVKSQGWVKPEMTLEPAVNSKDETLQTVRELHDRYVQQARAQLLDLSIILPAMDVPASTTAEPV